MFLSASPDSHMFFEAFEGWARCPSAVWELQQIRLMMKCRLCCGFWGQSEVSGFERELLGRDQRKAGTGCLMLFWCACAKPGRADVFSYRPSNAPAARPVHQEQRGAEHTPPLGRMKDIRWLAICHHGDSAAERETLQAQQEKKAQHSDCSASRGFWLKQEVFKGPMQQKTKLSSLFQIKEFDLISDTVKVSNCTIHNPVYTFHIMETKNKTAWFDKINTDTFTLHQLGICIQIHRV